MMSPTTPRAAVLSAIFLAVLFAPCAQGAGESTEQPLVEKVRTYLDARKEDRAAAARTFYAEGSRIWFGTKEGPGRRRAVDGTGPWQAWDRYFHADSTVEEISADGDAVSVVLLEINDFYRLIERPASRVRITYYFDAEGRVEGTLVAGAGEKQPDRMEEFEAWARENRPDVLRELLPEGEIVPELALAKKWRAVLGEWRREVGLPPILATLEAEEVLARMLAAHGGTAAWKAAPTVAFEHEHHVGDDPNYWLSREIVDQATGRAYLEWPRDEAIMVWDGKDAWHVGWQRGLPPSFLARLTYDFLGLPWLLQGPNVVPGQVGEGRLPCHDGDFVTVEVTFDDGPRLAPGSFYRLFVEPESHLLRAVEFDITHPGLVPPGRSSIGPMLHLNQEYTTLGGLTLPTYYVSFPPNAERSACTPNADHRIRDLSFSTPFPDEKMARPPEAELDPSSWLE